MLPQPGSYVVSTKVFPLTVAVQVDPLNDLNDISLPLMDHFPLPPL